MKRNRIGRIAGMIVLTPLLLAVLVAIVMLLWNALLPGIFKFSTISFWQAAGLLLLSRLLFGGRGRGFGGWRHRLRDRFARMTPEERDQLRTSLGRAGRATDE